MLPAGRARRARLPSRHWYGTRVYDPGIDAWHILWSDPVTQFYTRQIGRARGADIVQEGTARERRRRALELHRDHAAIRSTGSASARADGGATWRLQVEFFARRVADTNV